MVKHRWSNWWYYELCKTQQSINHPIWYKLVDLWSFVGPACVPFFIAMSIYNAVGLSISKTHPAVTGTITAVLQNQGRHHITDASVDFPSSASANFVCHVDTWFRGSDQGIYPGAPITVVPAVSGCGTPWFPDHIPAPSEGLYMAAGFGALGVAARYFKRRMLVRVPLKTHDPPYHSGRSNIAPQRGTVSRRPGSRPRPGTATPRTACRVPNRALRLLEIVQSRTAPREGHRAL